MQCVILAGGLGSRVLDITKNKIPKSLIPIKNIPFIDYQLRYLSKYNFNNIILCVSHLQNQIEDYVKNGEKYNINVKYVSDGDSPIGTGGAIRKAYDQNVLEEDFAIIYGDSFLPVNYDLIYNYYKSQNCEALMTIYKNNNNLDNSNANFDGKLVNYNKFNKNINYNYIDYGLSFLNKKIVKMIPKNNKFDLSSLFNDLSILKKLYGYEVFERFYEIGSVSGINDFESFLNNETLYNNT